MTALPGNLNWLPAHENTHLLAAPVAQAISSMDVFVAEIDPEFADTAAFCEYYDVGLQESANCVVVEGRRGEETTLAAVMVLATDRADVNKTIRKHLGARKTSFAAMDLATSITEMEYGGITPIGLPVGWPILVDERVGAGSWLVIGSGIRGSKLAIRGADLAQLPGAEVLGLSL